MSTFQTVLLTICGFAIVISVIIFSFTQATNPNDTGPVTIWGTVSQETFDAFIHGLQDRGVLSNNSSVTYVEKPAATFSRDLTTAVADNKAPDIVMIDQDNILANKNRLYEIPFGTFSEREFKNSFVQEGELFLTSTGILGFPLALDPLVTYWNRDIFATAGIANPPVYWDELLTLSPKLTVKDAALNIKKSAVAMGEWSNIPHAKEILSALIMQAGSPIVATEHANSDPNSPLIFKSVIANRFDYSLIPGQAALDFYTQFSNPVKSVYTWNRSLPSALDHFTAGGSALYFGFASELQTIHRKNPNLNFDVSPFLQSRNAARKLSFGRLTALSIVRTSTNKTGALTTIATLTSPAAIPSYVALVNEAPARRDIVSTSTKSAYEEAFYEASLQSQGWLDPNPTATAEIFRNMLELTVSGAQSSGDALRQADISLNQLFTASQ